MAINLDVHGNTQPLEAAVQAAVNRIRRNPIKVTVDDKGATQPLGNMKRGADEFSKSMEAANARIIAFGASMAIMNGVANSFKAVVKNAVEVEKALADINVVMGLTASNLDRFSDGLFKVAKETGAAFNIAAQAATEYARQGLSVEESLKRTRDALILTRLTGMDSAQGVKALTAAMNTYGKEIKDTTQLVSKFAAVDVKFAVSAEDFADAIARTGQAAKSAGVNIDELIGLVTAAQQQTARGGKVIGNSFKTIFTRIGRTDTLNQLENLGIAVRDLEGNTLGAKRILTDLANSFDHLSESQKAQIAQTVGGVFQINVLKAVLSDAAKQNGILANATQISAGATDEAIQKNEQLRQTMAAMATETGLALKDVSARVGEIMLGPGIEKILNVVKSLADGANALLGDGESAGGKFANGFLKGLGNVITGPGLVVITVVFGKLFLKAAQFAKESLVSLIGVTSEAQKQKAIQSSLVALFGRSASLSKEMLSTETSKVQKEQIILNLLKAQVAEAQMLDSVAKRAATTLYRQGYNASLAPRRGRASGYIPNFAHPERQEAAQGGYAAGNIRSMNMPGGDSVIYNSAEKVKNFAGFTQPAIMPPLSSKAGKNYQQAFGDVHGFDPYAGNGYIPNFNKRVGQGAIRSPKLINAIPAAAMLVPQNVGQYVSGKGAGVGIPAKEGVRARLAKMLSQKSGVPVQQALGHLGSMKIAFKVAGVRKSGLEKYADDEYGGIETQLRKDIINSTVNYAKSVAPKSMQGTSISPQKVAARMGDGLAGAKGALGSVYGAIFEAAFNEMLGLKSTQDVTSGAILGGDFDVVNADKNLMEIFGPLPKKGDYKASSRGENAASMAAKIAKELIHTGRLNMSTRGYSQGDRLKKYNAALLSKRGPVRAYGHIPNFADPLSDAIGREKGAGVPVSQIRVGTHQSLIGKGNPLGIGVTNTKDEPNGLRDVFGADGHIPNYAFRDGASRVISNLLDKWKSVTTVVLSYEKKRELVQMRALKNNQRFTAQEAVEHMKGLGFSKQETQQSMLQLNYEKQETREAMKQAGFSRGGMMAGGGKGKGFLKKIGGGMGLAGLASIATGFIPGASEPGSVGNMISNATVMGSTGATMGAMTGPLAPIMTPLLGIGGAIYGLTTSIDEGNKITQENTKALALERAAELRKQGSGFGSSVIGELTSQQAKLRGQSLGQILKPVLSRDFRGLQEVTGQGGSLSDFISDSGSTSDKLKKLVEIANRQTNIRDAKGVDRKAALTGEEMTGLQKRLGSRKAEMEDYKRMAQVRLENHGPLDGVFSLFGGTDEEDIQADIDKYQANIQKIQQLMDFSKQLTTDGEGTVARNKNRVEIERFAQDLELTNQAGAASYVSGSTRQAEMVTSRVGADAARKAISETVKEIVNVLDKQSLDKDGKDRVFKIGEKEFNRQQMINKIDGPDGNVFAQQAIETFITDIEAGDKALKEQTDGIIRQINVQKQLNEIKHQQALADLDATNAAAKFSKSLDDLSSFLGGSATSSFKLFIKQEKERADLNKTIAKKQGQVDTNFKLGMVNSLTTNATVRQGFKNLFGDFNLNTKDKEDNLITTPISDRVEVEAGKTQLEAAFKAANENATTGQVESFMNNFFSQATTSETGDVSFAKAFANLDVDVMKKFLENMKEADSGFKATIEDLIDKKQKGEEITEKEINHLREMFDLNSESKKMQAKVNDIMKERAMVNNSSLEVERKRIDMLQKQIQLEKLRREVGQGPGYVQKSQRLQNALDDIDSGIEPARRTEKANMSKTREDFTGKLAEKNLDLAAAVQTRDSTKDAQMKAQAAAQVALIQKEITGMANVMVQEENNHQKRLKNIDEEAKLKKQKLREDFVNQQSFTGGFKSGFDQMLDDTAEITHKLGNQMPKMLRDGLAEAMGAAINGAEDLGDVLRGVAMGFLQAIQQAMLQKAAGHMIGAMGFSKGGRVPAMVTNGEYIMNKDAVNKYGGGFMHSLNARGRIPTYSNGGATKVIDANKHFARRRTMPPANGGAHKESAIGMNFAGSEGFQTGRRYQSEKMSGFFYSGQAGNVGLQEDTSSAREIIQERIRRREEKKAKKRALMKQIVGTILSVGISHGIGSMMNSAASSSAEGMMSAQGVPAGSAEYLAQQNNIPVQQAQSMLLNSKINNVPLPSQFTTHLPAGVQGPPMSSPVNLGNQTSASLLGAPVSGSGGMQSSSSGGLFGGFVENLFGPGSSSSSYWGSSQKAKDYRANIPQEDIDAYKRKHGVGFFASGGFVSGKSGIDQIPAMLSEGEYVIKASSARRLGPQTLNAINTGRFNDGGAVTPISEKTESGISGGNTNNISISVNIDKSGGSSEEKSDSKSSDPKKASDDQTKEKALSEKLKEQVVATILEEQRPGGLLAKD